MQNILTSLKKAFLDIKYMLINNLLQLVIVKKWS